MRVVAEYRQRAKQCRNLAARASDPADRKTLKYLAASWAKMATLRERNLTDKDVPPLNISLRIKSRTTSARHLVFSRQ
jgi:hypothetical protein